LAGWHTANRNCADRTRRGGASRRSGGIAICLPGQGGTNTDAQKDQEKRKPAQSSSAERRPRKQWPIGQRSFNAALDGLMMHRKSLPYREEREILTVAEQHSRSFHPTRRLASRACDNSQACNLFVGHRQLDRLPPSCHDAFPRLFRHKRGIHEEITGSMPASFMESVV
jgi:hypothetical protein